VGKVNSKRSSLDGVPKRVHPGAGVGGVGLMAAMAGKEDERVRREKGGRVHLWKARGTSDEYVTCLGGVKVVASAKFRVEKRLEIFTIIQESRGQMMPIA